MKLFPSTNYSLIRRLALSFSIGTLLVLLLLGSVLVFVIRGQIEMRDQNELNSKASAVVHILNNASGAVPQRDDLHAVHDMKAGHANLEVGIMRDGVWLIPPKAAIASYIETENLTRSFDPAQRSQLVTNGNHWWIRHLVHPFAEPNSSPLHVVVAVDVQSSKDLLSRLNFALIIIGLSGAALVGLLSWWVARTALAPLERVAAQAQDVSAQALGEPLKVEDAPIEVRGMVTSINDMLMRLQLSFRSLEQYGADIAHELRTPINSLLMQSQVTLSRDRTAQEYREAMHAGMAELNRLQRMVTDMLFIARAERGLHKAVMVEVDIAQVIAEVVEYFELAASEKGQQIKCRGTGRARCDALLIRRAITNLVSNAVRYAPEHTEIVVEFSLLGSTAVICVENECKEALSRQDVRRLMSRFTRHDHDQTTAGDGLGLGLSIVSSIMLLHAGELVDKPTGRRISFELRWAATA